MADIAKFPDIDVPWDELENAATDMGSGAGTTKSYLEDAQTAWKRLNGAYSHDETQATVYAALDELSTPVSDWKDALKSAKTAICDFVATGRKLQKESEALESLRPGLKTKVTADPEGEDSGTTRELTEFNSRARALRTDWSTAQSTAVEALDAITTGTGGSLPMAAALGGLSLPPVKWADFTAGLDEEFGAVDPVDLLPSLRGLSPDELRAWADANPEASKVLANNKLMGPFLPGTPEAIMAAARGGDAPSTKSGIKEIRDAWLGLGIKDQEKLLLLYPGVFGNLNGVPMAKRATSNIITVAGYREEVRNDLDDLGSKPDYKELLEAELDDMAAVDAAGLDLAEYKAHQAVKDWENEKARLDKLATGLDYAMDADTQVVMISIEGDGQTVAMKGQPSSSTTHAATLVPGTTTDLGSFKSSMERLDAIDGDEGPERVSFYWQGTDLPDKLHDNVTSKYNEEGAPRLAAFDYAVDAEIPEKARTTYVSHSAGGSLLGTAERVGLTSKNIVYAAPAGMGHDVGSPGDTDNQRANRYWIQTRDDPIVISQWFGGGYHGDHVGTTTDPVAQMGAHRLESGFLNPKDPDSLVKGHSEYFRPGSTSAKNIQAVIDGGDVSPFIEDRSRYSTPHSYENYSPLEENPEDYAYGKLKTVPIESLEK